MIAAKTTVKNPAVCPLVLKITNEIKKRAIGKMLLMHLAKDYLVGHKLASIPYKLLKEIFNCPYCHTKHDRDLNASINIRNYALGIIDDRYKIKLDKSRVGITQSYACGDSTSRVSKYGYILDTSYLSMKQEAHLL